MSEQVAGREYTFVPLGLTFRAEWNPYRKVHHYAALFRKDGGVSALCFKSPRRINLKQSLWTIDKSGVTCKKCLAALKARGDAE